MSGISLRTSDDLTREQTDEIIASLSPMLVYLARLTARMEKTFPGNDPLLAQAYAAKNELQALRVRLHYIGCGGGVGRAK